MHPRCVYECPGSFSEQPQTLGKRPERVECQSPQPRRNASWGAGLRLFRAVGLSGQSSKLTVLQHLLRRLAFV